MREVADGRTETWARIGGGRDLSPDHEFVGVAGEAEFARTFGIEYVGHVGSLDGGVDFTVAGRTIDVKTARRASFLLLEVGGWQSRSEVLVLAEYSDTTRTARLVGWEFRAQMLLEPVRDFGHGIRSHHKPSAQLRAIDELRALLGVRP